MPTRVSIITADDLFRSIAQFSTAERSALIATTAAMSITQYYEGLLKVSAASSLNIAGHDVSNSFSQLKAQEASYQSLAKTFGSVGAYWKATGYDPAAIFNQQQLSKTLDSATQVTSHPGGLSLADATCKASDLVDIKQLPVVGSSTTAASSPFVSADSAAIPGDAKYVVSWQGPNGSVYMGNSISGQDQQAINYLNNFSTYINSVPSAQTHTDQLGSVWTVAFGQGSRVDRRVDRDGFVVCSATTGMGCLSSTLINAAVGYKNGVVTYVGHCVDDKYQQNPNG